MSYFFEKLYWKIAVTLDVHPEVISVFTEYTFHNSSTDEKFYYALLPGFQPVPFKSLVGDNKIIWVEAQLIDQKQSKKTLFSTKKKVEGIHAHGNCYMPIPWLLADGHIPPENFLKLGFTWAESGPTIKPNKGSRNCWIIHHCLPLSKLFFPFEISRDSVPIEFFSGIKRIDWEIRFPEGVSFLNETGFDTFKPFQKKPAPDFNHFTSEQPKIKFSIAPPDKCFSDYIFTLPVDLEVPADSLEKRPELKIFKSEEKTHEVSVVRKEEVTPFSDKLSQRILALNSRICVGLDPDLIYFPKQLLNKYALTELLNDDFTRLPLQRVAECIIEFNKMVIDAVCEDAVAVKPQIAHYERFGHYGIMALEETARYAREKRLLIILDAKRNDIGSTAEKYAHAYLGSEKGKDAAVIPFDAITINPYLGYDGIKPFIDLCIHNGKGIFILVKTSNKSSGDLQDLQLSENNVSLSQAVASMVNDWGKAIVGKQGYSSVGAVVGATYPKDIIILRKKMPNNIFLMPGYGAQGAKSEDIAKAFCNKGLGAIINSSRGILYPCPPETVNFQGKIREEALKMKAKLNSFLSDI